MTVAIVAALTVAVGLYAQRRHQAAYGRYLAGRRRRARAALEPERVD